MIYNQRKTQTVRNHAAAKAYRMTPEMELYTAVVTASMAGDKFYESSEDLAGRITSLVKVADPFFVAKLAVYARTEMNLRTVPLFLLVTLASCHNGDDLVSRAVSKTVLRADEICELLACYQAVNRAKGPKKLARLSKGIQNGLKESFNRFDEYQFAKYDRDVREVTLKDALFLVHPKAKDEAQQALFDKIVTGSLETPYTWETELSALGQQHFDTPEVKAAAVRAKWEELTDSRKLGYMALLRNLRNILDAGVGPAHIETVCATLADPERVRASKQLPFRFLSAFREVKDNPSARTSSVLTALEAAIQVSAENISGFDKDTDVLLASDVSGSMYAPVSRNSSVMMSDIGLLLSMILQNRCTNVITGVFGNVWARANFPRTGILANTMAFKQIANRVGYSTNGHRVVDYLIHNRIKVDKVMMFTDCQMWDSSNGGDSLQASWSEYHRMFPEAKLYLFDLAGYGQSPVNTRQNGVTLIAGWSDRIFDILEAIENGSDIITEIMKTEL